MDARQRSVSKMLTISLFVALIFIGKTSACEEFRPHPNGDCQAFVRCINNAEIIMRCGPGTVFNPMFHVCDYPYNVQCPESKPSTPSTPSTPKVTTPQFLTTTTQSENDLSPPCPTFTVQPGKYPNIASGCKSYFHCYLGKVTLVQCPEGLIFDTWIHECNLPRNSFCGFVRT